MAGIANVASSMYVDSQINYLAEIGNATFDELADHNNRIIALDAQLSTNVVRLTDNQSISGVKTFTESPIVPTPPLP